MYLFSVVWFERECSGQHVKVVCILEEVLQGHLVLIGASFNADGHWS